MFAPDKTKEMQFPFALSRRVLPIFMTYHFFNDYDFTASQCVHEWLTVWWMCHWHLKCIKAKLFGLNAKPFITFILLSACVCVLCFAAFSLHNSTPFILLFSRSWFHCVFTAWSISPVLTLLKKRYKLWLSLITKG